MSVNSKMTAIADKIRTLRGTSGTMGLDAMATHIGNEQTAITAALAALTEKGVDVPAGSTSDALAGLIGAIESSPNIITGSFTLSDNTDLYTITHNLGVIPKVVMVWCHNKSYGLNNNTVVSGNPFFQNVCYIYGSGSVAVTAYTDTEKQILTLAWGFENHNIEATYNTSRTGNARVYTYTDYLPIQQATTERVAIGYNVNLLALRGSATYKYVIAG